MARKAHGKKAARKAGRRKKDNPRKYLSADALFYLVCGGFGRIPDDRPPDADISLPDALMSAFAMFSLKDPSLLAFDQRRNDENLKSVYHIENIPSDTHLRTILGPLDLQSVPQLQNVLRSKLWDDNINSMEKGSRNRRVGKKLIQWKAWSFRPLGLPARENLTHGVAI